jgi:1-acyl-sn-glycerol-3-phosphate acyltransferase
MVQAFEPAIFADRSEHHNKPVILSLRSLRARIKHALRMDLVYRAGRLAGQIVFFLTMRKQVLNAQIPQREGGFVLALTHLSHVEPFCASVIIRRRIDWMTRKEFFKNRLVGWFLCRLNAFRVNRQGIPVSAVRIAIARARRQRVVGICPEGGVRQGPDAAFRGGPIKRGCCSVALRASVPIIPCLMLGTDKLNKVGPWLPFKRARIWVAYGEPIHPPAGARSNRATRARLSQKLQAAYVNLYAQMRQQYGIRDCDVP